MPLPNIPNTNTPSVKVVMPIDPKQVKAAIVDFWNRVLDLPDLNIGDENYDRLSVQVIQATIYILLDGLILMGWSGREGKVWISLLGTVNREQAENARLRMALINDAFAICPPNVGYDSYLIQYVNDEKEDLYEYTVYYFESNNFAKEIPILTLQPGNMFGNAYVPPVKNSAYIKYILTDD